MEGKRFSLSFPCHFHSCTTIRGGLEEVVLSFYREGGEGL